MGKIKDVVFTTLLLVIAGASFAQDAYKSKSGFSLEEPIITDSASTLLIPISYNTGIFSSNKLAAWDMYYANMVFYNFKTDSSFRLFGRETYIRTFKTYYFDQVSYRRIPENRNFSRNWILYRVKNIDYNRNNRIDEYDPDILYVSDNQGKNLKQLTTQNENVVSIEIYRDQNFALIKLQRDLNKDGRYHEEDRDFYYVRIDLTTLKLGQKIEVK